MLKFGVCLNLFYFGKVTLGLYLIRMAWRLLQYFEFTGSIKYSRSLVDIGNIGDIVLLLVLTILG